MMLRVNGEYLDFDSDIDIESQVKLFQDVETSNGDFSYSFEIPKTNKNLKALGFPFPDSIKSIYSNVPCDMIDDSGFLFNSGSLKIESIFEVINASFFGGNNNWFSLLSNPLSSLPLHKYDVPLTLSNIVASWSSNSGLTFPIIDTGTLVTRSYNNLKVEDFTPVFYVKTLFKEIFNPLGIKLKGDLLNDDTFNALTVAANGRSQREVSNRSCYVNKTTQQVLPSAPSTEIKITFEDETTFPFFDGEQNNFVNSTYTADVKMVVDLNLTVLGSVVSGGIQNTIIVYVYKNSVTYYQEIVPTSAPGEINYSKSLTISLEQYDQLEIHIEKEIANPVSIIEGSTFKITPTFVYKSFGVSSVPNWLQSEFVANVIKGFNTIPSYNASSKTLTLNLFNKIKEKEAINISDAITITGTDFTEFVSNYGKDNYFSYQESNDEDLREYNISNFINYGSGTIEVDNDFVQESVDVITSDFTSPITYLNGIFDTSMERIDFVELEEIDDKTITSVTDASGTPRFNISNADELFVVGSLVAFETTVDGYNGEWVVSVVTSSFIIVVGLSYTVDATGAATLLRHQFTTSENVYLFITIPVLPNLFFSSKGSMYIETTTFTQTSLAYFNLLSNGRQVNTKYKQSLSFGSVNNPLSYQRSILDTYWPIFSAILNDPVMLKVSAYFNRKTYSELKSFLRPLRVKTNETNNLYYLNRITGYKSGHEPCEVELIKL